VLYEANKPIVADRIESLLEPNSPDSRRFHPKSEIDHAADPMQAREEILMTESERREASRMRSERWRRAHGIMPRRPAQQPWLAMGGERAFTPDFRTLLLSISRDKGAAPLLRAAEQVYLGENDSSLKGDVSMGDNLGSLIAMKPKPAAS